MPSPNFILGKDCKAYWGSTAIDGGSNDVETLLSGMTEAGNIKDLTLSIEKGTTDITVRSDGSWVVNAATLKDATVSFQCKWLPSNSFFAALLDSFINDEEFPFVVLDQARDVDGAQGFASNFHVTKFDRNEALVEAVMADIELKPSSFPQWHEVELGS